MDSANYIIRDKHYRYHVINTPSMKKVICFSRYAGRHFSGTAICSPNDEFNINIGCSLSKLRCDKKINKVKNRYIDDRISSVTGYIMELQEELKELKNIKRKYLTDIQTTNEEYEDIMQTI